jgi:hypothetical protein
VFFAFKQKRSDGACPRERGHGTRLSIGSPFEHAVLAFPVTEVSHPVFIGEDLADERVPWLGGFIHIDADMISLNAGLLICTESPEAVPRTTPFADVRKDLIDIFALFGQIEDRIFVDQFHNVTHCRLSFQIVLAIEFELVGHRRLFSEHARAQQRNSFAARPSIGLRKSGLERHCS